MTIDLGTLIIIGVIILLVIVLISRLRGSNPYGQQGAETPQYDDPNIQSRGGIGRRSFFGTQRGTEAPRYDSPKIESRGGFGGSESNPTSSSSNSSPNSGTPHYDSPKIKSRGGFGGSKQ